MYILFTMVGMVMSGYIIILVVISLHMRMLKIFHMVLYNLLVLVLLILLVGNTILFQLILQDLYLIILCHFQQMIGCILDSQFKLLTHLFWNIHINQYHQI